MRIMAFGSTVPGVVQDTGFLHPNAGVNDTSIGTKAWNNPSAAKDNDGNHASCQLAPSEISYYLKMSDYVIPGGCIQGIEVRVERTCNDPDMKDFSVRLVREGVPVGDNKAMASTWGVNEVITYGSSTDLWGVDWHGMVGANYGVAFAAQNHHATWTTTAFIDYIWIKVYYSCYEFETTLMEDDWQSTRPPIVAQTSGAAGVFDFFGSDNFPPAPVVAKKKFAFTGASSAVLEGALRTLRATTIAEDRSKLWWLDRDGSTRYWSWAKCTLLKATDTYQERGRWLKKTNVDFLCPEGVWYGETLHNEGNSASPFTLAAATVKGNYPAVPSSIKIAALSTKIEKIVLTNTTTGFSFTWDDTGGAGIAAGKSLIVDCEAYTVENDGADAYDKFSTGSNQLAWMYLKPGVDNVFTATITQAGGTWTITIDWYSIYIF